MLAFQFLPKILWVWVQTFHFSYAVQKPWDLPPHERVSNLWAQIFSQPVHQCINFKAEVSFTPVESNSIVGNLQTLNLLLAQKHIWFSVFEIHHTEETRAFTTPSLSSFLFPTFLWVYHCLNWIFICIWVSVLFYFSDCFRFSLFDMLNPETWSCHPKVRFLLYKQNFLN